MATSEMMPKWIFFFGCLLISIGMGAGLLGLIAPKMFFSDFPDFDGWDQIPYVTIGWGIRNLGMGGAMILALWLRTPSAIGVIFTMQFLTESGDLLNSLITGHGTLGLPLAVFAGGWIVLFLIPEALAGRWGLTRAFAAK